MERMMISRQSFHKQQTRQKQMKKVINYKGIELVVGNRGDIWYKGKKLP